MKEIKQEELKRVVKIATIAALGTYAGVKFYKKNGEVIVSAVHAHKSDSILIDLLNLPGRVAATIDRDKAGELSDVKLVEQDYPDELAGGIIETVDQAADNPLQPE